MLVQLKFGLVMWFFDKIVRLNILSLQGRSRGCDFIRTEKIKIEGQAVF